LHADSWTDAIPSQPTTFHVIHYSKWDWPLIPVLYIAKVCRHEDSRIRLTLMLQMGGNTPQSTLCCVTFLSKEIWQTFFMTLCTNKFSTGQHRCLSRHDVILHDFVALLAASILQCQTSPHKREQVVLDCSVLCALPNFMKTTFLIAVYFVGIFYLI